MIYEGKAIKIRLDDEGIAVLDFDLQGESINKFNRLTLEELRAGVDKLIATENLKGVIVTSSKETFIVGADITEFLTAFSAPEEEILEWLAAVNKGFSDFEDLPVPTVAAINGLALGGGFEMALSADFRVLSSKAKVGFPEVKLGIFPGFGGSVRFPRLVGVDNAIEWIAQANERRPDDALKIGAVDAVVAPDKVLDAAYQLVRDAIAGKIDYKAHRRPKLEKLQLNPMEQTMAFESDKAVVAQKANPKHYPQPFEAIKAIQKGAGKDRDGALEIERQHFVKVAKGPVAASLIGLFFNDQALKKKAKVLAPQAKEIKQAAVLGAGIMGGGIAYQSALKGVPILMKDINEKAIDLGIGEASKLLGKRLSKGRLSADDFGKILSSIRPTLSYADFGSVDLVVEAVVENPKIKRAVLTETEGQIGENAILTSNTSTISINHLAEPLQRKDKFAGLHFFNPVHMMPLVEVIRGKETSDETVATLVTYATKIGKNPIVVNDGPGFLVNRVLFPYLAGFAHLVSRGADIVRVDKLMEGFGWPMGPAYLSDVVGIDTCHHARDVMAEGFPDRMKDERRTAVDVLYETERFGQKNGKGFYLYETDKKGKPKKKPDPEISKVLESVIYEKREFTDEEIINWTMIPLVLETVRALEDGIVETPAEADMALIYGIGFPPFRGGALRYLDSIGLDKFVEQADQLAELGALYHPTEKLRERAKNGQKFFG